MRLMLSGLVLVGLAGAALPGAAEAKGCIRGAVVGGVAGHVAGHHGLLGAAAGCAVGHHMANRNAQQARTPSDQQQFNESR